MSSKLLPAKVSLPAPPTRSTGKLAAVALMKLPPAQVDRSNRSRPASDHALLPERVKKLDEIAYAFAPANARSSAETRSFPAPPLTSIALIFTLPRPVVV